MLVQFSKKLVSTLSMVFFEEKSDLDNSCYETNCTHQLLNNLKPSSVEHKRRFFLLNLCYKRGSTPSLSNAKTPKTH